MEKAILKIFGRMQGVFFRASVKEMADELGLGGWVKNELDGSEAVAASGSEEQSMGWIFVKEAV